MKDHDKTKEQLINELVEMRQRIAELEASESERRQAEEALRESEKKYRQLVKYAPTGIYEVDLTTGRFTSVNDVMCEYTGYTREEFLSLSPVDLATEDYKERVLERQAKILAGEQVPEAVEYKVRGKTGREFWVILNTRLVYEGGKPVRATIVAHDITERKRAEEALRAEKEFSENMLNALVDTVFVFDPNTGNPLRWNKAFNEISSYTDEEVASKKAPDDWYSEEDLKRAEAATEKILQEGRAIVEMSLVTKDGRLIPTEYTGSLIRDAEGRPQYVIAVGRDITERKRAEEVLQESEERYRVSLESAPYGIVVHDQDEKILIFNPQMEKITGYFKEQIPDVQTWLEKVYLEEEYRRFVIEERKTIALEEHPRIREAVITRKDGEKRICQFVSSLLPSGIRTIFINDITKRKQAEEALQESEQKYRTVVEDMPALVCRFLPDGVLTFVNEHYCRYFNKRREELEGHNFSQFIPREERRKIQQHYASLTPENPVITYEHKVSAPDGTVRWQRWTDRALFDKRGRPVEYQSIGEDITERKRAEEQLAHMATHDALTDLPNRTLFNDRLTLALAHAQRNQQMLAVMLLDLDHFKDVNDMLGHSVGDKLLQIVCDRLASLLRKSDTVARMGGDEFMLLLPETAREEDAAKIATKILETFREPFAFDDYELHITTSIGIAIYPNDGGDADALMRNADIAMYRAKDQGRDNYQCYTSAMKVKALE